MGYCSPAEYPFCDWDCCNEFERVVTLETGGDPSAFGVEPDSRLYREAVREVTAKRVREYSQWRDNAEREYAASRPRRLPSLWRSRYCGF